MRRSIWLLALTSCGTDVIDHSREVIDCGPLGVLEEIVEGAETLEIRTVSEYGGTPIAGVAVKIDDGAWMTSDAAGKVSVPMPRSPYHVLVDQTISVGSFIGRDVWEINARRGTKLTICVDGSAVSTTRATITGGVRGAAVGQTVQVFVPSHAIGPRGTIGAIADGTGRFEVDVFWEGASREVEVFAFAKDDTRYAGYAKAPLVLTASPGAVDIELAAIGEAHVQGSASGAVEADLFLALDGTRLWLGQEAVAGAFDFVIPVVEGGVASLELSTRGEDGSFASQEKVVALPSSDLAFTLPPPIIPLAPADGATIALDLQTFSWATTGGDSVLSLSCSWRDGETRHVIHFRTMPSVDDHAALPVLPGVAIPAGAACEWRVYEYDGDRSSASARRRLIAQ